MQNLYLNFSDSAKYADIAKSLFNGLGYRSDFSFFGGAPATSPVMPYSIAAFFKIFGVGDFAVTATSFLYFVLTLIFVYFLGKRIFNSKFVGAFSTLAIGFNYDLIHYATNGASESPFIFEIVAGMYFASLKKRWANVVTIFLLILMYFTRPQAFIYIAGIILYWLLTNFKPKKAIVYFVGIAIAGLLFDFFVLMPLSGKYYLYSIFYRGFNSSFNQSSVASDALRGAAGVAGGGITQTLKNIFYNLYNFYKLLPQIINPYLFALFIIGLFRPSPKAVDRHAFKIASVFMILTTFLVVAASIPFFRYLHPVIPLIYIIATATVVDIMTGITNYKFKITNQIPILNFGISKNLFIILNSLFIILLFGVGQTLGVLLLDSRFERNTHNVGKPPVYVELSKTLKENTEPDDVVITNLDTWGSWYGERKTVWFPLEPKQIINLDTGEIPFDAIYLTSYLIDDANYYMGNDWRMIFNNPNDPKKWTCSSCDEITKEFTLKGVYKVPASDNYERLDSSAILLIKK